MQSVAILTTTYNTRDYALSCVEGCLRQEDSLAGLREYRFDIWLLDDGSSDGTAEMVKEKFPDVHVIRGGGGLYWNQGMRAVWTEASAHEDYDFYLWLNPKITLLEGAFGNLLENSRMLGNRAILAGTGVGAEGKYSFGGIDRYGHIIAPDPTVPIPCHTFNGNLVLVPRAVYKALGNLSDSYTHRFGDFDYGIRAGKAGIPRAIAPGVLAEGNPHSVIPYWRDASFPLRERYRFLLSPKGLPFREHFVYNMRSRGLLAAIADFVSVNLKVWFPKKGRPQKTYVYEQKD